MFYKVEYSQKQLSSIKLIFQIKVWFLLFVFLYGIYFNFKYGIYYFVFQVPHLDKGTSSVQR